jgi:hypothetical protein
MGAGEEGSAALGDLNCKLFRNVIRTQSYVSFLFLCSFLVPIDHRLSDYCAVRLCSLCTQGNYVEYDD